MKIDRLFAITNILLDKKTVTAKELAEKFDVSIRTIYRDIDILSINGIPVFTLQGKGGGISILEGYLVDKTMLSDIEQKQVLMALESMHATGKINVEDSIQKLRNVFQKEMRNWVEIDFSSWEQSDTEKSIFEQIRDGILQETPLSFTYFAASGEATSRLVEPIKLIFKGNSWYLYGYCRLRNDYRFFKLRRIEKLMQVSGERVKVSAPKMVEKSHPVPNNVMIQLQLKIDAKMGFRVFDEFRNGTITEEGDFFLVQVTIPEGDWLLSYLLSYGATLEVMKPEYIRKLYIDELKNMLNHYL